MGNAGAQGEGAVGLHAMGDTTGRRWGNKIIVRMKEDQIWIGYGCFHIHLAMLISNIYLDTNINWTLIYMTISYIIEYGYGSNKYKMRIWIIIFK